MYKCYLENVFIMQYYVTHVLDVMTLPLVLHDIFSQQVIGKLFSFLNIHGLHIYIPKLNFSQDKIYLDHYLFMLNILKGKFGPNVSIS